MATTRLNMIRGVNRAVKTSLAAAVAGSPELSLWQHMAVSGADVAVCQNASNKRSLTQAEKTAAENGSKNIGVGQGTAAWEICLSSPSQFQCELRIEDIAHGRVIIQTSWVCLL